MKTIGQIYEIISTNSCLGQGICNAITMARKMGAINDLEEELIENHFMKQKPRKYSWWWWTSSYTGKLYWWPNGKIKPRKRFLKFLIKKYRNKYFYEN